jgi:hypothetical protein
MPVAHPERLSISFLLHRKIQIRQGKEEKDKAS